MVKLPAALATTLLCTLLIALPARAEVCVSDDRPAEVCLDQAAARIIALSPSATELVYAAGAGDKLVAAVSFADYPEAARSLPRVGSYDRFDLEAILALKPDLLVGWVSGNPAEQLDRLKQLGLTIYYKELRTFEDVATTIERLGQLAGSNREADREARNFREGVNALRARYGHLPPVPVFHQIWLNPLMTVNNEHIISEATHFCGGTNIFGQLPRLVPRIDREAVLAANPEAIISGGMAEDDPSWLDSWRQFEHLTAVKRDNLFFIPPSTLQRPTPRLLDGATLLCQQLERARARRP